MPVATETVFLHLKAGSTAMEPGTDDALQLKKIFGIVGSQKGFKQQFFGVQIEDPTIFIWSVDWDDISDHKAFVNSEAYKPFTAEMVSIFDFENFKPFIIHANLTDGATAARQAPVTEFAFFMISKDSTTEQKSALEDAFLGVTKLAIEKGKATDYGIGWVIEDMPHEAASGGIAANLQCLIGWPTKEDHEALRADSEFLEAVKPIRAMALPPKPGKSMFHVKFQGKKA